MSSLVMGIRSIVSLRRVGALQRGRSSSRVWVVVTQRSRRRRKFGP